MTMKMVIKILNIRTNKHDDNDDDFDFYDDDYDDVYDDVYDDDGDDNDDDDDDFDDNDDDGKKSCGVKERPFTYSVTAKLRPCLPTRIQLNMG